MVAPEASRPDGSARPRFSTAAREVIDYDKKTGKPFRIYHALKASQGGTQLHFFVDIEEATRSQMLVSLVNRREQMVSDGLMLSYDQDHWNDAHASEEPIQLPMDLTFDIELRKNVPDEDEGAA
ncbi:hypothetical protein [Bradyrhizobium sp. WSM3983]|uniref:hypothetical protein n=1 Tax=Bradyrhizobium sp. WSM3983 TaxID=1038867 RepID=UPI0018DE133C|nr:hypothetical protein [Bradyrhizobium sp. WSM3983]